MPSARPPAGPCARSGEAEAHLPPAVRRPTSDCEGACRGKERYRFSFLFFLFIGGAGSAAALSPPASVTKTVLVESLTFASTLAGGNVGGKEPVGCAWGERPHREQRGGLFCSDFWVPSAAVL